MRPGSTIGRKAAQGLTCLVLAWGLLSTVAGAETSRPVRAPSITRLAVYGAGHGGPGLRSPLAIVRDEKSGDLLVSSFESGEILIFNDAGAFVKVIGAESGLVSPYGVGLDDRGRILVTELETGLLKILSPGGALLERIDLTALRGRKVSPGRVSVGRDGRIHVVDLLHHEVLVLSKEGALLRKLGPLEYAQKAGPAGDGRMIGLSALGKAVSIFDAEGSLLRSFGEHGERAVSTVSFPTGFALDSLGRLWIADAFQHRIKVFALDGSFLFNYGRFTGEKAGFFFPVDLCFADDGRLFVLEKGANRIQVFRVEDLAAAEPPAREREE